MMRDNLARELSLGEFAHFVNLSVWRVCHVFRAEVGMSPIQYLRVLRMEKATYLLETSFLSVKEITHSVGLNDESHFVRDFKKVYGVPPTLYRALFNRGQVDRSDKGIERRSEIRQEIAETAKRLILPSLNIFAYVVLAFEAVS